MEVLVAVDDYCLLKVVITAAVAGVKINVLKGKSHEELRKENPSAKSLLLRTSSGVITQHVPMLRYIAEMTPAVQLMGVTAFDLALVDQWLDFSWCELGKKHALISIGALQLSSCVTRVRAKPYTDIMEQNRTLTLFEPWKCMKNPTTIIKTEKDAPIKWLCHTHAP